MNIIEQMLSKYEIESEDALINALKEVYQEIALLGLYRGGFFQKAAFYGGTALRIIHGLDRFSEDMDFSLLSKDPTFDIETYFPYVIDEFEALGIKMTLRKKTKTQESDIESAFLKNDTSIHTLDIEIDDLSNILDGVHSGKKLKIKFEVDTNPPLKFQTTSHTLLLPTTFNITAMTLPNLYAGKLHAVLFRNWKTRVKGRDWYDFEWYVKRGIKVNLEHLQERMQESGNWGSGNFNKEDTLTEEKLKELLKEKIDTLDIEKAKEDIQVFVRDQSVLDFWSRDYFKLLTDRMAF
ncbi:MAG: nucleotidyl transferase AbiEii/AbiGii toxin family protein [Sulfurovum sp.]|nr:nucleotidyl transferase AbiEii/AbiGii toxin family protein [Sulfurovum sp.]